MINKDSEEKKNTPNDNVETKCEEHIVIKDKVTGKIILNKRG